MRLTFSGNSSVGRARPCQGRGREFESRFPLHIQLCCSSSTAAPFEAGWQSGHAADCKSVNAGSIPTSASSIKAPQTLRLRGFLLSGFLRTVSAAFSKMPRCESAPPLVRGDFVHSGNLLSVPYHFVVFVLHDGVLRSSIQQS